MNERNTGSDVRHVLGKITDNNWSLIGAITGKEERMHPTNNMTPGWTFVLKLISYVVPPQRMHTVVGSLVAGQQGEEAFLQELDKIAAERG